VQSNQKLELEAEKGDEANKPLTKKKKQAFAPQSSNVTLKAQVRAVCDIFMIHAISSWSAFEVTL
jgi:hypothetical protein